MGRRDPSKIDVKILIRAYEDKRVPIWTKDGIQFRMGLKTTTAKNASRRLTEKGLVRVVHKPYDNERAVIAIEITPEGQELLARPAHVALKKLLD